MPGILRWALSTDNITFGLVDAAGVLLIVG